MGASVGSSDSARDFAGQTQFLETAQSTQDWSNLLFVNAIGMQKRSLSSEYYSASLQRIGLGPIDLSFLSSTEKMIERTDSKARRAEIERFILLYFKTGAADLRHRGRAFRAPEGSLVLLDNRNPYYIAFPSDSVCLTAHIDETWLRRWLGNPDCLVGEGFTADRPWVAPLTETLSSLQHSGLDSSVVPRRAIADNIGALLALIAGDQATAPTGRSHETTFLRFRRTLHEQFDDPNLTPMSLARELGVSKRLLHSVFARNATTFGVLLNEIRLMRAADMLMDQRFSDHPISDIAWATGFADASYFARRFREHHGCSPTAFRSAHKV